MSTTKERTNITLAPASKKFIKLLAKRDRVPLARKVSELVEIGLELEEDIMLGRVAEERMRTAKKFIPYEKFNWGV